MFAIKKTLKNNQLETYLLIVFPLLWIFIISLLSNTPFSMLIGDRREFISRSLFFGSNIITKTFVIFFIYIYLRLAIWLGYWTRTRIFKEQALSSIKIRQFFLSFCYLVFAIAMANLLLMVTLNLVSILSSKASIIHASELYMSIDRRIMGLDPQLWMQRFSSTPMLDFLLLQAYRKLDLFFLIVFLGLLLFDKEVFRKFLITIFLAPLIAFPFWYALPAVTPNEMYRNNMFSLDSINETQKRYEDANLSPSLKNYLQFVEENIENPKQEHPLVATNPSMHVGWGIIITYFAILLWRPLGFVYIPWLFFNILSTIYTLQHYVVDLPPGMACAVVAIFLSHCLLKWEKKYYQGNYRPLYFVDAFQADLQRAKNQCLTWFLVICSFRKK